MRASQERDGAVGPPLGGVDRALLVLQALAPAGSAGLALAEVAGSLGLNKTTVHRTLAALRHRGFVSQVPGTGAYLLGPAALQLADDYFSEDNLPALVRPALLALCSDVAELVHLGVLSGTQMVYLDKIEPERSVRVWSAVGRRNPAITTALGRALLAYRGIDAASLATYVSDPSSGEAADVQRLADLLDEVRREGFALESEENESGISCLAVPLLRSGDAVAAVSITAPSERMTSERTRWLLVRLRAVLPDRLPAGLEIPTIG